MNITINLSLNCAFLALGIAFSTWFGYKCFEIHEVTPPTNRNGKFQQYWFNFLGSIIGWAAGYLLLFYRVLPNSQKVPLKFEVTDLILSGIFFIGASGYLPLAAMTNIIRVKELLERLLKK
jgi:hypothetical protein